jgi:3-hydroxyisobutyrate dehydrogenase
MDSGRRPPEAVSDVNGRTNLDRTRQSPVPPDRVGVIGLGTMGGGIADRLLDRGVRLTVHNRTAAKAAPFAERGAAVATGPAELAAAVDVVLLSLADQSAVDNVLFGADSVLAGLRRGTVVLDTSTVDPGYARSRAERLVAAGHESLDACIVGNGEHARAGELRFLVGGPAGVVDRVRPLLDVLGKEVTQLGGSGAGASMKLVLNMLMGIEMQALAEAVVFGERSGLPRDAVLRAVVNSGFSAPVMRFKAGVMQRRAFSRADFRLALMRKDMALVRTEAQRMAIPLAVAEASYGVLTAAVQQGLGELDCAAVLVEMERLAGLRGAPPGAVPPGAVPDAAPDAPAGDGPAGTSSRPPAAGGRP